MWFLGFLGNCTTVSSRGPVTIILYSSLITLYGAHADKRPYVLWLCKSLRLFFCFYALVQIARHFDDRKNTANSCDIACDNCDLVKYRSRRGQSQQKVVDVSSYCKQIVELAEQLCSSNDIDGEQHTPRYTFLDFTDFLRGRKRDGTQHNLDKNLSLCWVSQ